MVEDRELEGAVVAGFVRAFLHDRDGLRVMGTRAKSLARPDAAARLADLVTLVARQVPGAKFQVGNPDPGILKRDLEPRTWN
jgi:hypothetical protein